MCPKEKEKIDHKNEIKMAPSLVDFVYLARVMTLQWLNKIVETKSETSKMNSISSKLNRLEDF